MYAAMENKLVIVRQMLKMGCHINAVNKEGYSALHLGSMYAREPLVSLLLFKDANPSLTGGVSIAMISLTIHFISVAFCSFRGETVEF